jgi:hypothetical protein
LFVAGIGSLANQNGVTYMFTQSAYASCRYQQNDPLLVWLGRVSKAPKTYIKGRVVFIPTVWAAFGNVLYVTALPLHAQKVHDFIVNWVVSDHFSPNWNETIILGSDWQEGAIVTPKKCMYHKFKRLCM